MAANDPLPDHDEVTRWIKPKLLGRDDAGNVIVVAKGRPVFAFPEAFELRDDEDGLSITWLQQFGQGRTVHLPLAADAVRQTTDSGSLQSKSGFAVGNVAAIKEAGLSHDMKFRVIEDPIDGNAGHSEIRRYPHEMGPLQTVLAAEVFGERHLYGKLKIPGWTP
jgi:hypothetical protein